MNENPNQSESTVENIAEAVTENLPNENPVPDEKPKPEPYHNTITALGDGIGLPLCMFFLISTVIILAIQVIAMLFSSNPNGFLTDPNVNYIVNSCITLVTLTVPYLYTMKATKSTMVELVPVHKVPPVKCISLVMLGLGVSIISNYATALLATYADKFFGITFENAAPEYGEGPFSFILMVLCVGILPAILEEFAIRGFVLNALRKKFSDTASIIISSALFGLLHGNLQQIPFAFLLGIMLGYATVYSGSIIPSVLIHCVNNTISVIVAFATRDMSPMLSSVVILLYYAVALVIGVCGFIIIIKSDRDAFKLSKERNENTGSKLLQLFSSAWMIGFVIICILQVLTVQGVIG